MPGTVDSSPEANAAALAQLRETHPLPAGWRFDDSFDETTLLGGQAVRMVGLCATAGQGRVATGASARPTTAPPPAHVPAYFELLERIAILEARDGPGPLELRDAEGRVTGALEAGLLFPPPTPGAGTRPALSNGVALQTNWAGACRAAEAELWERDRVLRSFYGARPPRRVELPDAPLVRGLLDTYEWSAVHFDGDGDGEWVAAGLFGFPVDTQLPLAMGVAAGGDATDAMDGALRELTQRLAFLWGEELPAAEPQSEANPDFHQDHYLYPPSHAALRAWLGGAHVAVAGRPELARARPEETRFVDLTPACMRGRLAVARAVNDSALPLLFGEASTLPDGQPLPAVMRRHPLA